MEKNKIIIRLIGHFGNNLFLLALGEYLREKYKETHDVLYYIPNDRELIVNTVNLFFPGVLTECSNEEYGKIKIDRVCTEFSSITYSPIGEITGNVLIRGYRQCPEYWNNDAEFIRKIFGPKQEVIGKIKELYSEVDFENCISISLRFYNNKYEESARNAIKSHIGILPDTYYIRLLGLTSQNNKKYFVTADDIEAAKDLLRGDNFIFCDKDSSKVGLNKMQTDLYAASLCSDNLIPNSTFSWWGAYLNIHGNKRVVLAPYRFFKFSSKMGIYPKGDNWLIFDTERNTLKRI